MSWKFYRLVFEAKSPIHVGAYTLGYIKLTRPYIPGSAMWGAATAGMTQTFGNPAKAPDEYKRFGKLLKKEAVFSYFFPATNPERPILQRFSENGMTFGTYSQSEFQNIFIGSTTQTAVLPASNTAEDESLHESEYIRPKVVSPDDGRVKAVFFVGYLLIRNNLKLDGCNRKVEWRGDEISIETAVREISIGADSGYGWGRLHLRNDLSGDADSFFGNEIEMELGEDAAPVIFFEKNALLPGHMSIEEAVGVRGDIEPLVRHRWNADSAQKAQQGPGQTISSDSVMYWVPGTVTSCITGERLTLSGYGILKKYQKIESRE